MSLLLILLPLLVLQARMTLLLAHLHPAQPPQLLPHIIAAVATRARAVSERGGRRSKIAYGRAVRRRGQRALGDRAGSAVAVVRHAGRAAGGGRVGGAGGGGGEGRDGAGGWVGGGGGEAHAETRFVQGRGEC